MSRGGGVKSLFIFLLLGVYALLMLLAVVTGAHTYSRIVDVTDKNDALRTSVMYITGKVRGSDGADRISVFDSGGMNVLALETVHSDISYTTYIYQRGDGIYEYFSPSEKPFDLTLGGFVASAERLSLTLKNGLITATVTSGGQTREFSIALRGGGE